MRFGVATVLTDYSIDAAELGREVEAHGFESLFLPEHTHIPVASAAPPAGGRVVDREYLHALDPFVALAAVATATRTLKLGTGVCLVVQREPIRLAKQVATLDLLSNGRLLFGVGGGWNLPELRNHGTEPALRWRLLRERVLAMQRIWTEDAAEFQGELVRFGPLWSWPKPVQRPHPPVLIGGDGLHTLQRVVAFGDGWMPVAQRGAVPLPEKIARLQELAAQAGRGPVPVTLFRVQAQERAIARCAGWGIDRCVFWLPVAPRAEVMPALEHCAELAQRFA